ncbi:mechanosensitive ion channel family protein [Photobacterium leiognathi]|uniref:mechanosensitive ion channel family protein n=1 Tax=Photobacterium leiognathi TaxID=553611 RepID=UPI002980F74C|nr:mechanosensitive ion channel domain-containing protein [Photobacterium leiognathi]
MTDNAVVQAIVVFVLFIAVSIVIDKALKKLACQFDSEASSSFRLMSNSQKTILIFVGAVLAFSKLGFDVTGIVTGLGLTGFALGLALKDAISNLVAGVMIVLYKPIKLGYWIEVANSRGQVVDLNLRYITIKDDGATHLIPNSLFLSDKITINNIEAN